MIAPNENSRRPEGATAGAVPDAGQGAIDRTPEDNTAPARAPLSLLNVRRTLQAAFKDNPTFRLPTASEERSFRSANARASADQEPSRDTASPALEWCERVSRLPRAPWTGPDDLADYFANAWAYWAGHTPNESELAFIVRTAQSIWSRKLSEQAVPVTAVCAWVPCGRRYEKAKGFGIFCSRSCADAEVCCA